MAVDNLFYNGQTKSCPFIFTATVQPCEWLQDLLEQGIIKPNAVIFHADEHPLTCPGFSLHNFSRYMNNRWGIGLMKLERIPNHVLQNRIDLDGIGLYHR